MNQILNRITATLRDFLPLSVETVSWDGAVMQIGGDSWQFNCMSPWRLATKECLLKGSDEEDAGDTLKSLVGRKVVRIESVGVPSIDPLFVFDNEVQVQVFSIHPLEPWTFLTPDGLLYVSSPTAESQRSKPQY